MLDGDWKHWLDPAPTTALFFMSKFWNIIRYIEKNCHKKKALGLHKQTLYDSIHKLKEMRDFPADT